ncbi:MAG: lyase family protein [Roseobacter sp.]
MAASVFDSPLYAHLFPTGDTGRLFSDTAAIRAMLVVEGALAKVQGGMGIIPEISAAAIQRASLEIQIDPGALAKATGANGVCVPGLVEAFRAEMNAPEHAQYMHWGATSQDVIDTGLMLRLRQALLLAEADLKTLLSTMAGHAETHKDTPMLARTYGQHAVLTSWGAVLAQWGNPLIDALEALPALRNGSLWVSLSGAAGTASALGTTAADQRAALAQAIGLNDPKRTWHTDRGPVMRIADWMVGLTTTLGAIGQTAIQLASSDIGEISFDAAGASSTMPQKQNPVTATTLVALAAQTRTQHAGWGIAGTHSHQRDAGAWFTEWMLMPQIALGAAAALQQATTLMHDMRPDPARMTAAIDAGLGLCHAEALSFALSAQMSRPQAQQTTKELCSKALAGPTQLRDVAMTQFGDLPDELFDTYAQLGDAPMQAHDFVARVRAL